jgi:carboxymethylenebutenolidase
MKLVKLEASDGHELDAYVAHPQGGPIAGLVVVQEIFGVNRHIRSLADSYANDGFLAVAPALFDRYERGLELGYEGEDLQKAMSLISRLNLDHALKDTAAAVEYARRQTGKKVGVIGYCFGGTIAWLAAARLGVNTAVGYYGGQIAKFADEHPKAPIMLHFGKLDQHIPCRWRNRGLEIARRMVSERASRRAFSFRTRLQKLAIVAPPARARRRTRDRAHGRGAYDY